jgi:hypothetical protein
VGIDPRPRDAELLGDLRGIEETVFGRSRSEIVFVEQSDHATSDEVGERREIVVAVRDHHYQP